MVQSVLGGEYYVQYQTEGAETVNDHLNRAAHRPWPIVIDKDLISPPGGESDGDCYYVASGGINNWLGHDGELAMYYGGWLYREMIHGEVIQVLDEGTNAKIHANDGGVLRELASI